MGFPAPTTMDRSLILKGVYTFGNYPSTKSLNYNINTLLDFAFFYFHRHSKSTEYTVLETYVSVLRAKSNQLFITRHKNFNQYIRTFYMLKNVFCYKFTYVLMHTAGLPAKPIKPRFQNGNLYFPPKNLYF